MQSETCAGQGAMAARRALLVRPATRHKKPPQLAPGIPGACGVCSRIGTHLLAIALALVVEHLLERVEEHRDRDRVELRTRFQCLRCPQPHPHVTRPEEPLTSQGGATQRASERGGWRKGEEDGVEGASEEEGEGGDDLDADGDEHDAEDLARHAEVGQAPLAAEEDGQEVHGRRHRVEAFLRAAPIRSGQRQGLGARRRIASAQLDGKRKRGQGIEQKQWRFWEKRRLQERRLAF
eukprot:3767889-Rhodomonas_salina.1